MPSSKTRINSPRQLNLHFDSSAQYQRVGFLLRLAQVAVFKDLTAALKPLGLRPADIAVLRLIGSNPRANQRSLAEALRIQRPNMVTLINQLQRRGLVVRASDPDNRRSNQLTLTPKGQRHLLEGDALDDKHSRKVIEAIGPPALTAFLSALKRVAQMDSKA